MCLCFSLPYVLFSFFFFKPFFTFLFFWQCDETISVSIYKIQDFRILLFPNKNTLDLVDEGSHYMQSA